MTTDFAIRFNDFTGGDWGDGDPSRQPVNRWRGTNVTLYRSGLLGVRPGVGQFNVSDLPGGTPPGPYMFDAFGPNLMIVTDRLRRLSFPIPGGGGIAVTPYDAYPSPVTGWVDNAVADGIFYTLVNGQLFRHPGTTTVLVPTPAPLSMVTRWGLFLVGVDRDVPWRLWFSEVTPSGPQYATWPATNFVNVGSNEPIVALVPILNTLYCGRSSGWWSVSGVLGEQAYVREVGIGNGPVDPRLVVGTTDNRVAYFGVDPVPHVWNTASVAINEEQSGPQALPLPAQSVVMTPTGRRIIFSADRGADPDTVLFDAPSGRYERHRFVIPPGAWAPSDVRNAYGHPAGVVAYCMKIENAGTQAITICTWRSDADAPGGIPGDIYTRRDDGIGDDATMEGDVQLPAWYDGQGRQVMLRDVIVQFRKWGGNAVNNKMSVQARAEGGYQSGPSDWTDPVRFIEPAGRASTSGTDDSWRVGLGSQGWGNGFSVRFTGMTGVALREVVALVNVRTTKT